MGQLRRCSARVNTCRHRLKMLSCGKVLLAVLLTGQCVLGARRLRGNAAARDERSLLNTFPFNAGEGDHHGEHHGDHHGEHHNRQASSRLPIPVARQAEGPPSFDDVAGAPESDGKRCIDKVEMVEETEYDDVVQCDHSYDKRCHTTYVTNYESQQEEECDENFRKNCFIEYEQTAFEETVQICRKPLVKDCNIEGPEICTTQYESECWTKQEEHDVEDDVVSCETVVEEKCEDETSGYTTNTKCSKWPKEVCNVQRTPVKKYTPETRCQKVPVELCGPSGCGVRAGPQECRTELRTIPGEKPEEQCTLEPQRQCKHVTKLVPELKPHESCTDVPKEMCTRSRTNPMKVKKPVVKK